MKDPLLNELLRLELHAEDYAVFGSAPLFVAGLKESLRDVDVIARGTAWEQIQDLARRGILGGPQATPSGRGSMYWHREERIEFFDSWTTGYVDIDELIDDAETIDGIPFVRVGDVLRWKAMSGREKDRVDVATAERVISRTSHPS